jgi:predicted transcriptional regulator
MENATLRSVLVTLVEKGQVVRELRGKAYFYRANVPKQQLLQGWLRSMARIFAGGSPRDLVAQLVETGDLRPSDLARLQTLATPGSGPEVERVVVPKKQKKPNTR